MNEEEKQELERATLQAQLTKNSCKILHDPKTGAIKSIEVKAYGGMYGHCNEAVTDAVSMLTNALKRLQEEGFSIQWR